MIPPETHKVPLRAMRCGGLPEPRLAQLGFLYFKAQFSSKYLSILVLYFKLNIFAQELLMVSAPSNTHVSMQLTGFQIVIAATFFCFVHNSAIQHHIIKH